jgi:hypothetical protein
LLTFLIPESPVYLFFQGRIREGKESLEKLAKLNGKELEFNQADFQSYEGRLSVQSVNSRLSYQSGGSGTIINRKIINEVEPSQYFKIGWIQVNLVAMTSNWLSCSVNYQLITFNLKYLPGNVLLNNTMSQVSEIIGNLAGAILTPYVGAIRAF